jgi:hypothetical protein
MHNSEQVRKGPPFKQDDNSAPSLFPHTQHPIFKNRLPSPLTAPKHPAFSKQTPHIQRSAPPAKRTPRKLTDKMDIRKAAQHTGKTLKSAFNAVANFSFTDLDKKTGLPISKIVKFAADNGALVLGNTKAGKVLAVSKLIIDFFPHLVGEKKPAPQPTSLEKEIEKALDKHKGLEPVKQLIKLAQELDKNGREPAPEKLKELILRYNETKDLIENIIKAAKKNELPSAPKVNFRPKAP